MKIIDRESGKRLKEVDPVKGNPEKDQIDINNENSPMDPPEAYAEPTVAQISDKDFDESLQLLKEEHSEASKIIDEFEKGLILFKEKGYQLDDEINTAFKTFFNFFDEELLPHNRKEEKTLFPILHKRLIENGEHSPGEEKVTAIDMMEDDHIKFIQLGTLVFNFLGLAPRLRDEQSQTFTYDVAYNNAKELVELLKLHIFREDTTLFPLAQQLLTKDEFAIILKDLHDLAPHEHSESCNH